MSQSKDYVFDFCLPRGRLGTVPFLGGAAFLCGSGGIASMRAAMRFASARSSFGVFAMLMPAFHRYPQEGALVGRMVAGYGEIEFLLGACVGHILSNTDMVLNAMYRVRSEASRLGIADALGRDAFGKYKLLPAYTDAYGGTRFCLKLRNQYAHCAWADDHVGGLFFTNLEEAAKTEGAFTYDWKHVDLGLLQKQEAYFVFVRKTLLHIETAAQVRTGRLRDGADFPRPKKMQPPNLHNPPEKHKPPWLSSSP